MEEMRQRIDRGDTEREIEETIQVSSLFHKVCAQRRKEKWTDGRRQAMCDIARDRARKLQAHI